jgi:hypothetical protein
MWFWDKRDQREPTPESGQNFYFFSIQICVQFAHWIPGRFVVDFAVSERAPRLFKLFWFNGSKWENWGCILGNVHGSDRLPEMTHSNIYFIMFLTTILFCYAFLSWLHGYAPDFTYGKTFSFPEPNVLKNYVVFTAWSVCRPEWFPWDNSSRLKHNIGPILKSSVLCAILTYLQWI